MKTKLGTVILAVICLGLAIALIVTKKQADDSHKKQIYAILDISNQLTAANVNMDDLRQVNLTLTNDLESTRQSVSTLSNNLAETVNTLTETKTTLQSAQDQVSNLNGRVTDLEAQNKVLDARALALSNNIAALDAQITETQQKLATSDSNNTFLSTELQKQLAQKAELERKFNDLADVRAQVKKLRTEAFVARRLQLKAVGNNDSPKGAELLMQHTASVATTRPRPTQHYNLTVEVGSDGSVHVTPATTNAPAGNSPP
jgi:chromosome segregation ATPase